MTDTPLKSDMVERVRNEIRWSIRTAGVESDAVAWQLTDHELEHIAKRVLAAIPSQAPADDRLREENDRLREALAHHEGKRAPVQRFAAGIPWDMHLQAYDAYCERYRPQPALIEGGCRGGFSVRELDMFIPGWRDELQRRGDKARAALNTEQG